MHACHPSLSCDRPTAHARRLAQASMRQLFPFFRLWPDSVQRQLVRVLMTEVRTHAPRVLECRAFAR